MVSGVGRGVGDAQSNTVKVVSIIGTCHEYQYVRGIVSASCQEFRVVLKIEAALKGARAIAEEMSPEALRLHGAIDSIPRQVAEELPLAHRYCDPDSEERRALELAIDEDSIRMPMTLNARPSAEIEAAVAADRAKRESEWIRRLVQLGNWPVVFVCGRNHAHGFRAQLLAAGINATLYNPDWKPSRMAN